ncbi:hypothetical protein LTR85_005685 [Meristemomyces frigidus]|nr:hypothetical protein LTR85_005685 [Meristemomyces frigidus]
MAFFKQCCGRRRDSRPQTGERYPQNQEEPTATTADGADVSNTAPSNEATAATGKLQEEVKVGVRETASGEQPAPPTASEGRREADGQAAEQLIRAGQAPETEFAELEVHRQGGEVGGAAETETSYGTAGPVPEDTTTAATAAIAATSQLAQGVDGLPLTMLTDREAAAVEGGNTFAQPTTRGNDGGGHGISTDQHAEDGDALSQPSPAADGVPPTLPTDGQAAAVDDVSSSTQSTATENDGGEQGIATDHQTNDRDAERGSDTERHVAETEIAVSVRTRRASDADDEDPDRDASTSSPTGPAPPSNLRSLLTATGIPPRASIDNFSMISRTEASGAAAINGTNVVQNALRTHDSDSESKGSSFVSLTPSMPDIPKDTHSLGEEEEEVEDGGHRSRDSF